VIIVTDAAGGKALEKLRGAVGKAAQKDSAIEAVEGRAARESNGMVAYFSPKIGFEKMEVCNTSDKVLIERTLTAAAAKYCIDGKKLFVAGNANFKKLVVQIAASKEIPVAFADMKMEANRQESLPTALAAVAAMDTYNKIVMAFTAAEGKKSSETAGQKEKSEPARLSSFEELPCGIELAYMGNSADLARFAIIERGGKKGRHEQNCAFVLPLNSGLKGQLAALKLGKGDTFKIPVPREVKLPKEVREGKIDERNLRMKI